MTCPQSSGDKDFDRLMQQLADNVLRPEDLNLVDLELLLEHIGPAPTLTALVHYAREDVARLDACWELAAHDPPE